MKKVFGDEKIGFSVNCHKTQDEIGRTLAQIELRIGNLTIGNLNKTCLAGIIIHSANVFLKYSNQRNTPTKPPRELFAYLYENIYGDDWQNGMMHQFNQKFSVHEVFDIAISDEDWLVFLSDQESESILLLGSRDKGYSSFIKVPKTFVDNSIADLIAWLDVPLKS